MGMYEIDTKDAVFDMAEYNAMVIDTAEEVQSIRRTQDECAAIELEK